MENEGSGNEWDGEATSCKLQTRQIHSSMKKKEQRQRHKPLESRRDNGLDDGMIGESLFIFKSNQTSTFPRETMSTGFPVAWTLGHDNQSTPSPGLALQRPLTGNGCPSACPKLGHFRHVHTRQLNKPSECFSSNLLVLLPRIKITITHPKRGHVFPSLSIPTNWGGYRSDLHAHTQKTFKRIYQKRNGGKDFACWMAFFTTGRGMLRRTSAGLTFLLTDQAPSQAVQSRGNLRACRRRRIHVGMMAAVGAR